MLWCGLIVVLYRSLLRSRHRSSGLPLAFVLSITLEHCGGLVHLDPSYDHNANAYLAGWSYTRETVATGVETSVIGILAITVGVILANRIIPFRIIATQAPSPKLLPAASKVLIVLGIAATVPPVFFGDVIEALPGLAAVIGGFKNLLLLGICGLILYFALMRQRWNYILAVGGGCAVVLGTQMFAKAILGDSVAGAITIISFVLVLFQPKSSSMIRGLISLAVISYLLLIAAVAWLDIRGEVREAVWGQASFSERVYAFTNAVANLKMFDGSYQGHLEFLDARMNQNVTIGKAVEQLTEYPSLYRNGETLLLAAFGWVPRALWPTKPARGGSEEVSIYTGVELSDTSTFGTGPIFDFLINFGTTGVFIGGIFMVL